jgi:hypothetical protein
MLFHNSAYHESMPRIATIKAPAEGVVSLGEKKSCSDCEYDRDAFLAWLGLPHRSYGPLPTGADQSTVVFCNEKASTGNVIVENLQSRPVFVVIMRDLNPQGISRSDRICQGSRDNRRVHLVPEASRAQLHNLPGRRVAEA